MELDNIRIVNRLWANKEQNILTYLIIELLSIKFFLSRCLPYDRSIRAKFQVNRSISFGNNVKNE